MNDVKLFFNSRIEGNGLLAAAGDFGLTSVRYFFGGRTATILRDPGAANKPVEVRYSEPQKMNPVAAVFRILFVVFAVFKLLSYFSSEVRANHRFVRDWKPVVEVAGNAEPIDPTKNPIGAFEQASAAFIATGDVQEEARMRAAWKELMAENPNHSWMSGPGSKHGFVAIVVADTVQEVYRNACKTKDVDPARLKVILDCWKQLSDACPNNPGVQQVYLSVP